jgi:predicted nucleic acid-binding protein
MMLILDTSILIDLENEDVKMFQKMADLRSQYPVSIHITFMSYFEFYDGLHHKAREKLVRALAFLEAFETLLPTKMTAMHLSELKQKHPQNSLSDLIIAAQAIENNGILITRDQDFRQIKELRTHFL